MDAQQERDAPVELPPNPELQQRLGGRRGRPTDRGEDTERPVQTQEEDRVVEQANAVGEARLEAPHPVLLEQPGDAKSLDRISVDQPRPFVQQIGGVALDG